MSITYLLFILLPGDHSDLGEALVRSAACFLEAQGAAGERIDLGAFRRAGRVTAEHLTLVKFTVGGDASASSDDPRVLEGVLRATAAAAGVRANDLRVFVADEQVSP